MGWPPVASTLPPAVPPNQGGEQIAKRLSGWVNRLPPGRNREVVRNAGLTVATCECDEVIGVAVVGLRGSASAASAVTAHLTTCSRDRVRRPR